MPSNPATMPRIAPVAIKRHRTRSRRLDVILPISIARGMGNEPGGPSPCVGPLRYVEVSLV
jgi:hypothetical protein